MCPQTAIQRRGILTPVSTKNVYKEIGDRIRSDAVLLLEVKKSKSKHEKYTGKTETSLDLTF